MPCYCWRHLITLPKSVNQILLHEVISLLDGMSWNLIKVSPRQSCLKEMDLLSIQKHMFKLTDKKIISILLSKKPGRVALSVTCLATDACLTADPGVAS